MDNPIRSFLDLGFSQSVQRSRESARGARESREPRFSAIPIGAWGATIILVLFIVEAVFVLDFQTALPFPSPVTQVAVYAAAILGFGAIVLVLLAMSVHFLRRLENPTYWEAACWILVVLGIFARQLISVGDQFEFAIGALAVSAVVGIAVLPGSMRWLNRLPRGPGLAHVTVPFSLGFFVDLVQMLTATYIVPLPWL